MILQSLLGKQDVPSTLSVGMTQGVASISATNSFEMKYIDNPVQKSVQLKQNHKYVYIMHYSDLPAHKTVFYIWRKSPSQFFNYFPDPTIVGNTYIFKINYTGADIEAYVGNSFRSDEGWQGGETVKPQYAILLDLTQLGLDSLTAQQFYDRYNPIFSLLATGYAYDSGPDLSHIKAIELGDIPVSYITNEDGVIVWQKPSSGFLHTIIPTGLATGAALKFICDSDVQYTSQEDITTDFNNDTIRDAYMSPNGTFFNEELVVSMEYSVFPRGYFMTGVNGTTDSVPDPSSAIYTVEAV